MTSYAQLSILGGLPVEIEYQWEPGDRSVGLEEGIADWEIVAIGHSPRAFKSRPDWLYRRIEATKGEEDRIIFALYDHHSSAQWARRSYRYG